MKNVSHKKKWNAGLLQLHVDPPTITLIKVKHYDKSERDFVKIKLGRDWTSENLDLSESKMALLYNGDQEAFFVCS